jgi:hypothetical protein
MVVERTGRAQFTSDIHRHAAEVRCPKCGGDVIWVDESGLALSASRRFGGGIPRVGWLLAAALLVIMVWSC